MCGPNERHAWLESLCEAAARFQRDAFLNAHKMQKYTTLLYIQQREERHLKDAHDCRHFIILVPKHGHHKICKHPDSTDVTTHAHLIRNDISERLTPGVAV